MRKRRNAACIHLHITPILDFKKNILLYAHGDNLFKVMTQDPASAFSKGHSPFNHATVDVCPSCPQIQPSASLVFPSV